MHIAIDEHQVSQIFRSPYMSGSFLEGAVNSVYVMVCICKYPRLTTGA